MDALVKGNPEFNRDQLRNADGTWGGGTQGGPRSLRADDVVVADSYFDD